MPYEKVGKNEPVCIADEVPFEIPESWEWVRWGTLSESIQYGYNAPAQENGRIKMVRISDIQDNSVMWETVPYCDIKEGEIDAYLLKPNDILFARTGGTVGKSYLVQEVPEEAIYAGYLIRTRYSNQLCPQYLKYFMESELYWSQLREGTIATAQPNCNGKTLGNMLVPIPPSHEQIRIVEKLNAVMAHVIEYGTIDSRSKHLNNIFPERLKKSILQEAIQGKLVPQDPNDEPAAVLLERIRAEKQKLIAEGKIKKNKHESIIFRRDNSHYEKHGSEEVCIDDEIPFEIPENWTWTRLKNICSLIGDIDHNMPKSVSADVGVLFLSAKDLLDDGTINYTQNVKYISRVDFERLSRKALPQKHDIIYSRIGAALGKARLVEIDREFLVSYSCCVVRPLLVYAPYIRYYLESPQILLHSIKARQSIGVPDLGMGEIKKYLVALPPYNEQVRIVEQLEVLLNRCDFKK